MSESQSTILSTLCQMVLLTYFTSILTSISLSTRAYMMLYILVNTYFEFTAQTDPSQLRNQLTLDD